MKRRDLLKTLAVLPALPISTRLYAADSTQRPRVLLVFLRGGYDCANLLVPTASDFYYASRPNIAIARPGTEAERNSPA